VIVAADPANPRSDKGRVPRILALHKDAVAAENGGGAVTLCDLPVVEVDLCENPKASDDPRDRIPIHLDKVSAFLFLAD
jgi:hypothetical protein